MCWWTVGSRLHVCPMNRATSPLVLRMSLHASSQRGNGCLLPSGGRPELNPVIHLAFLPWPASVSVERCGVYSQPRPLRRSYVLVARTVWVVSAASAWRHSPRCQHPSRTSKAKAVFEGNTRNGHSARKTAWVVVVVVVVVCCIDLYCSALH